MSAASRARWAVSVSVFAATASEPRRQLRQLQATRSRAPARWRRLRQATSRDRPALCSSARRHAASYGVGRRRIERRHRQTTITSSRPGSAGLTACCATMRDADRAAAGSRSSHRTRRWRSERIEGVSCRSAGTTRGACPSPADAAGSDRAPLGTVSSDGLRGASASSACADRRRRRLWSAMRLSPRMP